MLLADNSPPPPIFRHGPPPLVRLCVLVSLCLVMLVVDLHFRYLEVLRQGLSVLTYPLQLAAAEPVNFVRNSAVYFSTLVEVQLENADLRRSQVKAAQQLLRFQQIEDENNALRQLLLMERSISSQAIAADVLYDGADPFARRMVLDRGAHHGVRTGQAVVDAKGVLGQITRVYPVQSEMSLLFDKNLAIPVQLSRSGARGVLFGIGDGRLELRFVSEGSELRQGDSLSTSGLDGIFLPGLPVAKISKIISDDRGTVERIWCEPVAEIDRARQVLILGRGEPVAALPEPGNALELDEGDIDAVEAVTGG